MDTSGAAGPAAPPQVAALRVDLKSGSLLLALPALPVAAFIVFANADRFANPVQWLLPAILLFCLPAPVWAMRHRSYLASAWLLVTGCLLVELMIVAWGRLSAVAALLAVPAGLAALSISLPAGVAVAVVCSLLLELVPAPLLAASSELRSVALIGVWATLGLIWLTTRPLLTAVQWSWSSYEQSRRLLEQARDAQVRLKQTLTDLADANLELTRLNRLAQGLRQAAEEARRAKEQFVANVSHELRTPLNMIIGFSEMIVEEPETYSGRIPPALVADLEVILRNSQHLASLIDDVLDLSQIETGQMALTKERTSLLEVIETAIVAVRPLFETKGLYLESNVPADLPAVFCDPTRVREVILNLLSNAGRFTECGGVCLRAWKEEGDLVVSIADTGPGIAAEDRSKLFQPFQQLDGSTSRRYGGTGLGLSISKSFVEMHGGSMWMESERGSGTTFYFRLPIDPSAPVDGGFARWFSPYWHYEERTRRTLARPAALRPRLIVLESRDALQRLLTRYLPEAEIVPVRTLAEAATELARVPAQALLLNEVSVADALRQLSGTSLPYGTPAIVYSMPGLHEAAGALGVADYLVKPISRDVLLAAVDQLPLKGRTILVVDDEPEALRLFWRMLSSAGRGYSVLTAADGKQALEILRDQHPDAALIDLAMPEMDGFQLLAAMNAEPGLSDIPTVVISARDPTGQPVISNALAVARGGGLSVPQLLALTEAITSCLSPVSQPTNPASTGEHSE